MGKKEILPQGYRQLEYIDNTSTAFINTGVPRLITNSYRFISKFTCLSSGGGNPSRNLVLGTQGYAYCGIVGGNYLQLGDAGSTSTGIPLNLNETIEVDVLFDIPHSIRTYNVKGQSRTSSHTYTNVPANANIWAFRINNDTINLGRSRFYFIEIYQNAALIRKFIPCINPNNVVGMYDTVEGKFYSSPNGVAFVAGPVV